MKRAAVFAAIALAMSFGSNPMGAARVGGAELTVRVEDSYYDPLQLAIEAGDTVVWTGFGGQDHTVTSDDSLFNAVILFGESFRYTFQEPGAYPYYCDNHGNAGGGGMSGTVVVSSAGPNRPPTRPSNEWPPDRATNQPPTLQLRASSFSDLDPLDFHGASQWVVRRTTDNSLAFDSGEDPVNRIQCLLPPGALTNGATYAWQVRYKDGRGAWSAYSVFTVFTTLIPVVDTGVGLRVHYGNSPATPSLAVSTNATLHFPWGKARPHRRITARTFVVRWEGVVVPEFTEPYDFTFQYRGQARVWVDRQLLIDEWSSCPQAQLRHGFISLVAGRPADIRVDYIAAAEGGLASLRWSSPSQALQVVPSARLFPPVP